MYAIASTLLTITSIDQKVSIIAERRKQTDECHGGTFCQGLDMRCSASHETNLRT